MLKKNKTNSLIFNFVCLFNHDAFCSLIFYATLVSIYKKMLE
jgi:hypothetical protein